MFWENRTQSEDNALFIVHEGLSWTYAEAFNLADTLFEETARGVVLILCERTQETIIAYLGALRANVVPLLVDDGIRDESFANFLDIYSPEYIFTSREIAPCESWDVLAKFGNGSLLRQRELVQNELHEDLGLLLTTSGSTGDPKTVRLTKDNVQKCTDEICEYLKTDETNRSVALLPFHYSYGLSVLHCCMNSRASIVLSQKSILDRDFWEFIEDHKITDIAGVPFVFEIMRRMKIPEAVLQNLRCVTQAGGRLDPRITSQLGSMFAQNNVAYFTMYGQTEAGPRIAFLEPQFAQAKLGSVGRPLPSGQVRVSSSNEEAGELIYSGPNVCMGYASNRSDLAKGDELQGELFTGDQARIDEDGFIFIVGRRARYLKLQGQSVSLDHVETVMQAHNIDCRAIGRDNLLIICHLNSNESQMTNILKGNFTVHGSSIKFQSVDVFPLKSSGKPDYSSLEKRFL